MLVVVSYFGNDSEVSIASSSSSSAVVVVLVMMVWLSAFELVFFGSFRVFFVLIRSIRVAWGRRAYRLISHDSRIFLKWSNVTTLAEQRDSHLLDRCAGLHHETVLHIATAI